MTNQEFIARVFPGVPPAQVWVGRNDTPKGPFPGGPAGGWLAKLRRGSGHYFCIGSLKPGEADRGKAYIEAVHAFVLDDIGTKATDVAGIVGVLGYPSWIIETSSGNYQYGWVYDKPVGRRDWRRHRRAIRECGRRWGVDTAGQDCNRVVRLPSGINIKPGKGGFAVRLVEVNWEVKVNLADLLLALGLDWDAPGGEDDPEVDLAALGPVMAGDFWVKVLEELGLAKYEKPNGYIEIECPWADDHTEADKEGTAYLGAGNFECQHSHCSGRHSKHFKEELRRRLLEAGRSFMTLFDEERRAGPPDEAEEAYLARKSLEHLFDPPPEPPAPATAGEGVLDPGLNPDGLGSADLAKVMALNARFAVVGNYEGVFDEDLAIVKKRPFVVRRLREWAVHFNRERVWIPPAGGKGTAVPKPLGNYWLGWEARRTYTQVDLCEPGHEPAGVLNVWPGLAVEARAGRWPLFEQYLREVVANGDKKMLGHVVKTLQWWVTHPLEQGYTYLVLYGMSGAGKTILHHLLAWVFGTRFSFLVEDSTMVLQGFNDHIANRLLVSFDEAVFGKNKQTTARLKSFISGPQTAVNAKYQTLDNTDNHIKALFFTNDIDGVPIDPGDRRATVLEVGESRVEDEKFYGDLVKAWEEGGEAEAFVAEALATDFRGWSPRQAVMSVAKIDAMIENARGGSVVRWWFDKLARGDLHSMGASEQGAPGGEIEVQRAWVVDSYEQWVKKERNASAVSTQRFWKDLDKLCPGRVAQSRVVRGDRFTSFPSLDTCRSAFEKVMGKGTLIAWDGVVQIAPKEGSVVPAAVHAEGGKLN